MPIQANVPEMRQGLFSPGLKKLGRGIGQMARESLGRLSETASIPGKIYKGELAPTQENAFKFAVNVAGSGLTGGFGRGGLGMGGRRFNSRIIAKPTIKKAISDEEAILNRLRDTAESQYKIGQTKYIKKQITELTDRFQKQVIKHGGIPKAKIEAQAISDNKLTEIADKIAKHRKMLDALGKEKNWI